MVVPAASEALKLIGGKSRDCAAHSDHEHVKLVDSVCIARVGGCSSGRVQ